MCTHAFHFIKILVVLRKRKEKSPQSVVVAVGVNIICEASAAVDCGLVRGRCGHNVMGGCSLDLVSGGAGEDLALIVVVAVGVKITCEASAAYC